MKYSNFDEYSFRRSVQTALEKVTAILGTAKKPRLAHDDSDHTYDDKYALAEFIGNTSISAQLAVLEQLGLTPEHLETVLKWVHEEKQTATLHFQAQDSCSFLKEESVEVVSSETQQETVTQYEGRSTIFGVGSGGRSERVKHKVIQKVKEYHWNVTVSYKLTIFKGNDTSTALELQSRTATMQVVTSGGQATGWVRGEVDKPIPPIPEKTVHSPAQVQLTWFLQSINPEESLLSPAFSIKRSAESCKTPRRNQQVDEAFAFHESVGHWLAAVVNFLEDRLERGVLNKHEPLRRPDPKRLDVGTKCEIVDMEDDDNNNRLNGKFVVVREYQVMGDRYRVEPVNESDQALFNNNGNNNNSAMFKKANLRVVVPTEITLSNLDVDDIDIFAPILPLLENGAVLPVPDVNALLDAQKQSIQESIDTVINKVFPPPSEANNKLVTQTEASLLLLCCHWKDLLDHFKNGVDYIENMLRKQLIQAIGKEVDAQEFDKFMRFHNQKLFGPQFAPKPFTYAIRRPQHYPDGLLSITATTSGNAKGQSIETMVRKVSGAESPSIFMPINAATSIEMTGDRFLHGWLQHRFESSSSSTGFQLEARARQFSSFLLVVGTMAGSDTFDPKAAIILQNKDEVLIPLLTNVLPTAQEFNDAIASLSPEQQAFCRAFREMQLESSVFGVCIVQLKPQLEKLLGLPAGALTKEIQLTQDLMSLFVDYQIPSDLLSFDGQETASAADKLAAVKGHVKAVLNVIDAEKNKQLKEEERKADMNWAKQHSMAIEAQNVSMDLTEQSATFKKKAGKMKRRLISDLQHAMAIEAQKQHAMAIEAQNESMDLNFSATFKKKAGKMKRSKGSPLRFGAMPSAAPKRESGEEFETLLISDLGVNQSGQVEERGQMESENIVTALGIFDDSMPPEPENAVGSDVGGSSQQQQSPQQQHASSQTATGEDFTLVPKALDAKFLQLDTDNALRSTTLEAGPTWSRMRQESLLLPLRSSSLPNDQITLEKNKAFDLLDAISRSGTLPIDCAELHVVICVSHCFENDLMGTVIQDNINPIEKVEKSSLIIGSTIHGESCGALLSSDTAHAQRLQASFPALFLEN